MPKQNDVCMWYYKDTTNRFEPYHCKSRIAIYNEDKQKWFDTFWSGADNFAFPDGDECIETKYLGNLDDYRACSHYEFDYYDSKDCLDITHKNMSRGGFYIRKDAVKSVDKIRKVLERQLEDAEYKKRSADYEIERIKEKLQNVTPDTWI